MLFFEKLLFYVRPSELDSGFRMHTTSIYECKEKNEYKRTV